MASGHAPGSAVVGVTISFTIVALVCTLTRLYSRFKIIRSAGLDDFFIGGAMVFSIVLTATMCLQVAYGMGRHESSLSDHSRVHALMWFWCSVWLYYLALCCAKFSILLQYLRIFPQQSFRRWTFATMGVVGAYTLWTVVSAIFACTPVQYFWLQSVNNNSEGSCLNRLAVWFVNASLNIATDVAIALLPLPLIKGLNMPRTTKLALMFVFCLGGVTCIISILRLESLYAISVTNDVSWENPLAAIWSSLEVNTGIICSCLPTLKTYAKRIFPRLFHTSQGLSSGGAVGTPGVVTGTAKSWRARQNTRHDSVGLDYLSPNEREKGWRGDDGERLYRTVVGPGGNVLKSVDGDGIQVVTVVEQDSRKETDSSRQSESESTRELV